MTIIILSHCILMILCKQVIEHTLVSLCHSGIALLCILLLYVK